MEDRYRGEQVLVFNRSLFEELGYFNGSSPDAARYMKKILSSGNNHFHLRVLAEDDPSLKQIIPYVLFVCDNAVFSYVRGKGAGEKRLVGNRSVGIGGHVNPIDGQHSEGGGEISEDMATYLKAVRREIDEEIIVESAAPWEPEIIGLINDDGNPVGKVHFGIIHVVRLSAPSVRKREQQITEGGFIPLSELAGPRREELETWSQIAVDFLLNR